jgi:hypothetical protein
MVLFAIYCAARWSTSLERLRIFSVEELDTHSGVGARARLESGEPDERSPAHRAGTLLGMGACRAACSCECSGMWFWWMLYERVFVCGLWGEEEDVWRCWCLGKEFAVGVDVGRVMDESVSAILPELQTTFFIFRFISCNISFPAWSWPTIQHILSRSSQHSAPPTLNSSIPLKLSY